jgi:hypothetical protein
MDCVDFDANTHCYLTGASSTLECGSRPCILSSPQASYPHSGTGAGALGYYEASAVGYHVCDENQKVYKQVYMNQLRVQRDTDTDKDLFDFEEDRECFVVVNVPQLLTAADCWEDKGVVGSEAIGGVLTGDKSLDTCKETCMLDTTCVAIHYNYHSEKCYRRATLGYTNNADGNKGGKLYERLRCARLPAALSPVTTYSDYK